MLSLLLKQLLQTQREARVTALATVDAVLKGFVLI